MALSSESLQEFITSTLGVSANEFNDESLLFTEGILDSFALVELVAFLEKEGGFRMTPGELALENLDSVQRMLAFAETKAIS